MSRPTNIAFGLMDHTRTDPGPRTKSQTSKEHSRPERTHQDHFGLGHKGTRT